MSVTKIAFKKKKKRKKYKSIIQLRQGKQGKQGKVAGGANKLLCTGGQIFVCISQNGGFSTLLKASISLKTCANGNEHAHFNLSLTATGSPALGVKTSTHHVEDDEKPGHRVAPQEDAQSYAARQQKRSQNGGRIQIIV